MNGMKAVIMAGGFGTRLKPITDIFPKPLAPVLNEPVLCHVLRHLCRNGINDAALTLKYMPEMIMSTLGDNYAGVNLKYYIEDVPLGTAGGVKACEDFLSGDFLVASGDGIWDYDLNEAYALHKEKNADVTIICHTTHTPMAYGVIMADNDGRIQRFAEKPSWGEVFSNKINTGIYIIRKEILKYIPKNTPFDFSKDLFPLLMKNNKYLLAYSGNGDWCDIGSLEEYRKCNIDALGGKYSTDTPATTHANASNSVLGDGVRIGENAFISNSVIHDGVFIDNGASVSEAIICKDAVIGKDAIIPKGCVIGPQSVIADGVQLLENTVIPTKTTVNGDELMRNIIKKGTLFKSDGIIGDFYGGMGNDSVCTLGAAIGKCFKTVGVLSDGAPLSSVAAEIFACGVKYAGGRCLNFKNGFYHMANFINMYYRLDVTVYIKKLQNSDGIHIILRDKNGLKLKAFQERKIEELFFSHDIPSPGDIYGEETIQGIDELYKNALTAQCEKGLENGLCGVTAIVTHSKECRLLSSVLTSLGADVHEYTSPDTGEYFCIDIESDGDNVRISQTINGTLFTADKYHIIAAILALCDKEGLDTVSFSYYAPPIYKEIAEQRGIKTVFYLDSPSSDLQADNEARALFYNNIFITDPLASCIKLLSILKKNNLTLQEAIQKVRPFFVRVDEIDVPYEKRASILAGLYEDNIAHQRIYGDGIVIKRSASVSTVGFNDNGFRIITESYTVSAASDAVGEIIAKVKQHTDM